MPRTTWALAGAGRFARTRMVPAICNSHESRIAGVWARNSAAAQAVATDLNAHVYPSIDAIAADPAVDIAYVAATAAAHPSLVLPLLRAGKTVLCEKPIALTAQAALKIASEARAHRVACFINHHLRANDCMQALRSAIDRGDLGGLDSVVLTNHQILPAPAGWRIDDPDSGGVIRDLTVHDLDAMQYLLGPVTLRSASVLEWRGVVETDVSVALVSDSGIAIALSDAWIPEGRRRPHSALVVHGDRGQATIDPAVATTASVLHIATTAGARTLSQATDAYERVAMLAAMGTRGEPVPLATVDDAITTLRLVEEIKNACSSLNT